MDQAPGANANPLFHGVPTRDWQLYDDTEEMVREYQEIMEWIINQLILLEAGFYDVHLGGQNHRKQITAAAGFFKLILRPPQGWVDPEPEQQDQGVHLLFSFKNLYLVGFLHNNIWYVFEDADLSGSGHEQNMQHWKSLNFGGGYINELSFRTVPLSLVGLYYTYESLSRYLERKDDHQLEIENALFRVIVVISEARRFPTWLAHLQAAFAAYGSVFVDSTDGYQFSGQLFKQWSTISKRVRDGPANFVPGGGFATYAELLLSVSVLLREGEQQD